METTDAMFSRRSIRRFKNEPLAEGQLTKIARAGLAAATAANRQTWRFIMVDDAELVDRCTDTLGWLAGEPSANERPVAHVVALVPKDASWAAQADAAAAIQNMLLAATDLGIGSCWFGSVKREDLASLLSIPDEWHIYSVAAFGLSAEEPVVTESEDTKITRDDNGQLTVPKKPLDSVLSKNGF